MQVIIVKSMIPSMDEEVLNAGRSRLDHKILERDLSRDSVTQGRMADTV